MTSLAMSGPRFSYGKDQIAKFDYRYLTQKGIEGLNYAKDQAVRLDYNHLFSEVSDRIKAHPYQTAFHVVNGVVFLAPGLVTGPILWGMGFGSLGPVAGELSYIIIPDELPLPVRLASSGLAPCLLLCRSPRGHNIKSSPFPTSLDLHPRPFPTSNPAFNIAL
jgi:hypothetical protein